MPLYFITDDSHARNVIKEIEANSQNNDRIFKQGVIPEVKFEFSQNLKLQRTPKLKPYPKSRLSQTDPTGSPRLTLIRSTAFYQDTQDNSNYQVSGNTLNVYSSVRNKEGELYGQRLNSYKNKQWQVYGITDEGINAIRKNIQGLVLYGKG